MKLMKEPDEVKVSVSPETILNWSKQLAVSTKHAVYKIGEYVSNLKRIHCDETGWQVQKSLKWMHSMTSCALS